MFKNTPAFCSLSAPDLAAIKKFYGEILSLDCTERPEGVEINVSGMPGHGGTYLFVYKSSDYKAPEHTVLNFMVDAIDAAVDDLAAKGVNMEQYPAFGTDAKGVSRNDDSHPGPKAIAWFKDPADHILAIIQEK